MIKNGIYWVITHLITKLLVTSWDIQANDVMSLIFWPQKRHKVDPSGVKRVDIKNYLGLMITVRGIFKQ